MDNWQKLMNSAYNKWQTIYKGHSYEEFVNELPQKEQQAVILGNLNYQVCNGQMFSIFYSNIVENREHTCQMHLN